MIDWEDMMIRLVKTRELGFEVFKVITMSADGRLIVSAQFMSEQMARSWMRSAYSSFDSTGLRVTSI